MKKSLIIGGAGFVGKYLAEYLGNELHHEVIVTKMPQNKMTGENIRTYDLDILNPDEILKVMQEVQPDYVFHLAAQSSVAVSWKNPGLTIDVNVKGAVNVLDAIRTMSNPPRVLLIGSGEEYGHVREEEVPVREETMLRPGNIYAATKSCQNMLGRIYAQAYGMEIVMVRAFNHIGPNQSPIFVVADFCKQVAEIEAGKREPVMYVGNLSAKRDFTDVRDVVRAYALLAEKGVAGETYNVGSGHARAIEEILHEILQQSKIPITVKVDPNKLRPVDVPVIEADIRKLNALTGWKPEIALKQTIKETLDYWRYETDTNHGEA